MSDWVWRETLRKKEGRHRGGQGTHLCGYCRHTLSSGRKDLEARGVGEGQQCLLLFLFERPNRAVGQLLGRGASPDWRARCRQPLPSPGAGRLLRGLNSILQMVGEQLLRRGGPQPLLSPCVTLGVCGCVCGQPCPSHSPLGHRGGRSLTPRAPRWQVICLPSGDKVKAGVRVQTRKSRSVYNTHRPSVNPGGASD